MKQVLFILSTIVFCTSAHAAKRVTCRVHSLRDAEACMQKVADSRPSFNNSDNEGFASEDVAGLVTVLELFSENQKVVNRAKKAEYAGMMMEYGDEYHIYYYSIRNGDNVRPVLLKDLNTVDFNIELDEPYTAQALNPDIYFLASKDAKASAAYEEVRRILQSLSDN